MAMKPRDLAKLIDHTLLAATANVEDVKRICQQALKYKFAAICVNPIFVPMCVKLLGNSSVKVTTVIGYPLGANTTEAKAFQTRQVVKEGVQEIDVVMNLSAFKSRAFDLVRGDIKAVVDAARVSSLGARALVKVTIEAGYLSDKEIIKASTLAVESGADFITTSTAFGPVGAKIQHINLIRKAVGREIGIKAAEGISTFEQAVNMLDAGANRIGTAYGVNIITGDKCTKVFDTEEIE